MDLVLGDDQVAMRDELRRSLRDRAGAEALFAATAAVGGLDRGLWALLADTGVFALCLPEADGGVGLGLADAAVVFEEVGRAAVPGPTAWTFLAAGVVGGAADGSAVVGGVEVPAPGTGADLPLVVEHLEALDALVVLGPGELRLVDPAQVRARPLAQPLDPLTPVAVVEGDLPAGEVVGGPADAARWRRHGALVASALQVGLAEAAVRLGTSYALDRRQFGRVIGSFQAVKHLLADALVAVEVARAALHAAAVELDEAASDASGGPIGPPAVGSGDGDGGGGVDPVERALASARVLSSRAAAVATQTCIQVHGGMGYTWELEAHLYLKRALVLDTAFGSVEGAVDVLAGV